MSIILHQRLDVAQNTILGRKTAGSGNWEVLTQQDVATLVFPHLKPRQGSLIYPGGSQAVSPSTLTQPANTLRAIAWDFPYPTAVDQIYASVNTAVAGASARVALYSSLSNGTPGTKLASTELLINGATATTQSLTFSSITLYARYWLVWNASVALSMRGIAATALQNLGISSTLGNNSQFTAYSVAQTFGVLPTTFPVPATLFANTPGMLAALRVA